MNLIEFPEQDAIFAKNQPEYMPMPAFSHGNPEGEITCCWQLSWKERIVLLCTGKIWHSIMTFHSPLQPQLLSVQKPAMQTLARMYKQDTH